MAFRILLLASALRLSYARPAPLFGNVLGGNSPAADNTPSYASNSRCPNGGAWTSFSDDFESQTSEWDIETGRKGVSYGKDGVLLSLEQSMVS